MLWSIPMYSVGGLVGIALAPPPSSPTMYFECKETDNICKLYYFIYLLPLGYIDKTCIQWHGLSCAYRVVEFDIT
jgi:hypothetical protein